jgi:hypothetical protein
MIDKDGNHDCDCDCHVADGGGLVCSDCWRNHRPDEDAEEEN